MCVDISKVYTFISSFEWSNFFSTLAGAGFGAWGAYRFSIKQAKDELKSNEKAKLLKLFYDVNILTKVFIYHHENTVARIHNLTNSGLKSCIPITLEDTNFDINEYGFLIKTSPKLYEILTYVHHDINYIYEQEDIASEFFCKGVPLETFLFKLNYIKVFTLKLLAKLYVSLININRILVKHYKCQNLIKEEVANSYIRVKKVINRDLKEYQEAINNSNSEKELDKEDFKTIRLDSEYINEIIDTWVLDFALNKKQKIKLEEEITKEIGKRWEAPENDL